VKRVLTAASLVPAVALFALSTGSAQASLLLAGAVLAAAALPGRFALGPALQRLATGMALAAGVVLSELLLGDAPAVAPRGTSGFLFAMAALAALLCAAVRRLFTSSREARRADVALEAAALVACGMARVGKAYPALATLWFVLALGALGAPAPGPRRGRASPRLAAWVALLTAVLAGTLGVTLPLAARVAEQRAVRWLSSRFGRSGFSDTVRLGALSGLLRSEVVVLRVWGPTAEYLRGAVYERYASGYWTGGDDRRLTRVATLTGRPEGAAEVRFAGRAERYFETLGASSLATPHGIALRDGAGTLRPLPGEGPASYAFLPAREERSLEPPTPLDLEVSPDLRPRLAALADLWTAGAAQPRAKVTALAAHLEREFTYDLDVPHLPHVDPVADFLFRGKRGYCEHFASALALLARSAGVPARVVGGYHAAETNPLGGYRVVRERDAHTWVEAWLPPEGWRTFDATPAEAPRRPSLAFELGDAASMGLLHLLDALRAMTLAETTFALAGALALWAVVRALNARRGKAARRAPGTRTSAPAYFLRFAAALARAGHAREPSEPLERLARRIAAVEPEAAHLLERYAALRYGGVGDALELEAEMDGCSARMRSCTPGGP